jgi:hypothetical protein
LYLSAFAFNNNLKIEFIFGGFPSEDIAREKKYTHLMTGKNKEENRIRVEKLVKKLNL